MRTIRFRDVPLGTFFRYDNHLFQRVQESRDRMGLCLKYTLEGECLSESVFGDDVPVRPIEVALQIPEDAAT